jgi:hypothetical protein
VPGGCTFANAASRFASAWALNGGEAERVAAQVSGQLTRAAPTLFSFSPIPVRELASEFLTHHEVVRRSLIATIRRYRTALEHLVAFLRQRQVSPNGHVRKRPSFRETRG